MIKILDKKSILKEGEKVPLCYDECIKIMFGNPKHMEPLTLLLSKVLGIEYEELEGRIELAPLNIPNDSIGYKKTERDIVVYIKNEIRNKIIIEVNMSKQYYETIVNKSLYYMAELFGSGLKESESYDKVEPTFLICFNTFYVDKIHKKMFDEYYYRNEEGYILTEKQKIIQINIVECYNSWYNGTYKALTNSDERDLLLISAAMYTKKIDEFEKCISEISTRNEIKKKMEEVSTRMNEDEELKIRYVDLLKERKRMNDSIINEEKRNARKEGLAEGRKEGHKEGREEGREEGRILGLAEGISEGKVQKEKELIINMHNNNIDIDLISQCTNISVDEIEKIIKNKHK